MKKLIALTAAIVAIAFLVNCNKQKPPTLDYTQKFKDGTYEVKGLPGDGHVGGTPLEDKYHGYHSAHGDKDPVKKPDEAKPDEKKPIDKKPDAVNPEEKKPVEEKKPEDKKAEEKPAK